MLSPVKSIMERSVATLPYGASLKDAASELLDSDADAVIVVHDDGHLVGLLTHRGIVFAAESASHGEPDTAGHYADARFTFTRENEDVGHLLERMGAERTRRAVVLDEDGETTGLVSLQQLGARPSLRPSPEDEMRAST